MSDRHQQITQNGQDVGSTFRRPLPPLKEVIGDVRRSQESLALGLPCRRLGFCLANDDLGSLLLSPRSAGLERRREKSSIEPSSLVKGLCLSAFRCRCTSKQAQTCAPRSSIKTLYVYHDKKFKVRIRENDRRRDFCPPL